ncbi:MAG: sigma-70 family RNA polymerase sigma factor [Planctomycetes bacterium]|nr:sigma-70 family RNA polymerase sigma factor [Planctomycetota bacterium]
MKSRADRRFARFVRTRDPRDLAFVFDATAPELWRVAAFLCRRQQDAEDAVQATFVVAIENAASWDASRPVLPWLLGMLVNRVRAQRRVDRRVVAVDVAERRIGDDPAQAAAERELHERVAELVAEVRGPFRAVLERALLHGEAPQQIAERLGLPAATVRSRLHRGLAALRRRLPAGALAIGPAVPSVLSPQVATRVRARVLERIGDGAPVSVAVVAAGFGLTSLAVLACAALAAVAATLWIGSGGWRTQAAVTPVVENGRVEVAAAAAGQSSGAGTSAVEAQPERFVAPTPAAAAGTLRVVVRHGGTGEVLPGIHVMAMHDEPDAAPSAGSRSGSSSAATASTASVGEGLAPDRADGDTDVDGRVTLRLAAGPARIVTIGGLPNPTAVIVPSGGELEVVLELPELMVADVLVLDADDKPVPGAAILQSGGSMGERLFPAVIGHTDDSGHWRSSRFEPELRLLATAPGHAPSAVGHVLVPQPACELRLGGPAMTVSGRVLDADGRAVPGAWVAFDHDVDANETVAVRADDDGRFVCDHVAPGRQFVIAARDTDGKHGAAAVQMLDVGAGTQPQLELRLPRGASLVVHIEVPGVIGGTRSASVRPQELVLSQVMRQWLTRGADVQPDGTMHLSGLSPGRYQLSIRSGSQRATREVELRDGEIARIDHVFEREGRLRLELVDEHGAPRPGLQVRWYHEEREAQRLVSDEHGVVEFFRVALTEQQVTIGGAVNSLIWMRRAVMPGRPVRVVVPAAFGRSRVKGRLVARGVQPTGMRVALQRVTPAGQFESTEMCQGELDADSREFTVVELPPGRFRLAVATETALFAMRGPLEVPAEGELDLGEIEVGLGSVQVVGRGVAAIVEPHLCLTQGGDVALRRPLRVVDGALHAVDAPVGSWQMLVWGENIQPVRQDIQVRSDAVTTVAVDPVPGTPTTLLLPDGIGLMTFSMADGRTFHFYSMGQRRIVRGMPRGRHWVELVTFGGERHRAEFEVGETQGEPVELR